MKTLSTYTEEKINILLEKYNAFFAFSQSQIDEAKKQNIDYVYRGGGLYHEAGKQKEFDADYEFMLKEAIEQDLKENGKEAIIKRALSNYESYYTCDISDAVESLKDYGISKEEIHAVFRVELSKHDD
jgi:uncharacterized membrane-anchored protein